MSDHTPRTVPTHGELLVRVDKQAEMIAELRALLREVAPKCTACGEIATQIWHADGPVYTCDKHHDSFVDHVFDLGRRIKKALEGQR